jgi:tetratricopeptide (TPR) repeat protein
MALFGGLFGNFEKLEQRGDSALTRSDPLGAVNAYRDALKKAAKKDPIAAGRIESKLTGAREQFVKLKLTEASEWIDEKTPDYAAEALLIARDNLVSSNRLQTAEIERLENAVRRLRGGETDAKSLDDLARPDSATAPAGVGVAGERLAPEDELEQMSEADERLQAEFEQLIGALPEEDHEPAAALGVDFMIAYVAHHNEEREESIKAFRKVVAAHPKSALANEMLGVALDLVEKDHEASTYFKAALDLDPKRMNSRIALASIIAKLPPSPGVQPFSRWTHIAAVAAKEAKKGALEKALNLLRGDGQIGPEAAATIMVTGAEFSLAHGRPDLAVANIDQLITASGGTQPTLWHFKAVASEFAGRLDDAEDAYEKAVELGHSALFFRAEFAEFTLRHSRSLDKAEELILKLCMG